MARRPAESIRLHHEMVLHVADEAGREFGIPAERRLLVGFSQSVGLTYRLAATRTRFGALSASAAACRATGTMAV